MADYIRRDIVLDIINTMNDTGGFTGYTDYCTLFDEIDTMPAADVQRVKRGHWIAENRDSRGYADCYTCSNCQSYTYTYTLMRDCEYDYCPNCGAKMNEPEPIKG